MLEAAPRSVNSMELLASMYRTGASFHEFGESTWTKDTQWKSARMHQKLRNRGLGALAEVTSTFFGCNGYSIQ